MILKIKEYERALEFKDGKFIGALSTGKHMRNPFAQSELERVDVRQVNLDSDHLDFIWRDKAKAKDLLLVKIGKDEAGLLKINGHIEKFLGAGIHAYWTVFEDVEIEVFKMGRLFVHPELEKMSLRAEGFPELEFYHMSDNKRSLVTVNGNFHAIFVASTFAFWRNKEDIQVEELTTNEVFFEHQRLNEILASTGARHLFEIVDVQAGQTALIYIDGKLHKQVTEGRYVYWRNVRKVEVKLIDLRESILEITGQEIMTSDKVSIRVNAIVAYRVKDALRVAQEYQDFESSLYKDAQMILRSAIGTKELDEILMDKEALENAVREGIARVGAKMGLEIQALGLKDIILPGEMKDILNRVTEAKKSAEAALITRREETAAMRSQLNTAKVMENNPTLLRLRELELAEKVASNSKLTIFAGEKGIAESMRALI